MTLKEASERFHISIDKLKGYEDNGFLEHAVLEDGSFDYSEKELCRVGVICSLLKSGMEAEDLKKYLHGEDKEEQIRILRKQRCELLDNIHERQQVLDEIDYLIREAKKS